MSGIPSLRATVDYREWQRARVSVAGRLYSVATKPGVFAHGREDAASLLMAEHAAVAPGDTVVQMNCGNGMLGAVAAGRGAGRVVLTDRNVVAAEAAARTLAANAVQHGEVLLGHGGHALPADLQADVVAIRIPQEKLALLQLLWDAFRILRVGGRCYLAGATNEGAKTAARTLERLFGTAGVVAHGGGHRLVLATKRAESPASGEELDSPFLHADTFNELRATLRGRALTLHSRPGVFSWEHVDEATTILAEVMQVRPGDRVLDLGCGAGALGVVASTLGGRVLMVDADVEAVRSATRSATAAGADARVATSDVASAVVGERFDVVVTNPPFHVGKATDLNVPLQFIEESWEVLDPGGRLFLVANRTLPYERAIAHRFGNIATAHDGPRFKVLTATRE